MVRCLSAGTANLEVTDGDEEMKLSLSVTVQAEPRISPVGRKRRDLCRERVSQGKSVPRTMERHLLPDTDEARRACDFVDRFMAEASLGDEDKVFDEPLPAASASGKCLGCRARPACNKSKIAVLCLAQRCKACCSQLLCDGCCSYKEHRGVADGAAGGAGGGRGRGQGRARGRGANAGPATGRGRAIAVRGGGRAGAAGDGGRAGAAGGGGRAGAAGGGGRAGAAGGVGGSARAPAPAAPRRSRDGSGTDGSTRPSLGPAPEQLSTAEANALVDRRVRNPNRGVGVAIGYGSVMRWRPKKKLFLVEYTDGDQDEFELSKLWPLLLPEEQEGSEGSDDDDEDQEEDSEEDGVGADANEGEHGEEGSTGGTRLDDDDLEAAADGMGV